MSKKKRINRNREDWNSRGENNYELKKRPLKQFVSISAMTQGQKKYIIEIKNHTITLCYGPAGTGKTACAVGVALEHIIPETRVYEKLVVLRPAKEACGEKIGFLPGDLSEKMGPWAAPIIDNMKVFVDENVIKNLFFHQRVEIIPLAYARGRSLNDSFIILDEAQNCSPEQMLMVLTRIGKNSKLVINGDIAQSDTVGKSGLTDAIERLEGMNDCSIIKMSEEDIVRNKIITEILKRYTDVVDKGPILR